jgi:ketosteroid isomerase-like protein
MRMLLWLLIVLCAASLSAQTPSSPQTAPSQEPAGAPKGGEDDIASLEQSFLNAVVSAKTEAVGEFLTADFVSVAGKIHNRAESLELIEREQQQCASQPMPVLNPQVSKLSKDVALIVYQTKVVGTCGTRKANLQLNSSSVWVHRDGKWQMQMHTEQTLTGFSVQSGEKAAAD